MKRISFYITVLFLTFVLGVAVTNIYFIWDVQFTVKGVGSIGMCEDGIGGFTAIESYDGEKLNFFRARFSSEQMAQECFQFKLKHTLRVIEREPLYDEAGEKVVGERVVALLSLTETDTAEPATIISLDGNKIFEIASTSLRHALIYDKQARAF